MRFKKKFGLKETGEISRTVVSPRFCRRRYRHLTAHSITAFENELIHSMDLGTSGCIIKHYKGFTQVLMTPSD